MIPILSDILCAILALPYILVNLLILVVNVLILAIGAMIGFIVGLLPDMPDPPARPESEVLSVLLWAVPLGQMLVAVLALSALYLAFMGLRIIMNWIKAI